MLPGSGYRVEADPNVQIALLNVSTKKMIIHRSSLGKDRDFAELVAETTVEELGL